eukprot:3878213-Lingulodinium_polyedra.AAC.1
MAAQAPPALGDWWARRASGRLPPPNHPAVDDALRDLVPHSGGLGRVQGPEGPGLQQGLPLALVCGTELLELWLREMPQVHLGATLGGRHQVEPLIEAAR